jgi:hypothetical protein
MSGEKSSSTAYNTFSLILQALQTAAAIGILVVLAMLLVQVKKLTDPSYVFQVGAPELFSVRIGQPSVGTTDNEPFYVRTAAGF